VLYDGNPDLCYPNPPKVHRVHLRSNSFRHQSLLPFDAVVLGPSSTFLGHETEELYGALAKFAIPLVGLGLQITRFDQSLSANESTCFARETTRLAVQDEASAAWFRKVGPKPAVLPCPSLFGAAPGTERDEMPSKPRVAVWLEEGIPGESNEETVSQLCEWITDHPALVDETWSPVIDDFMRFSTMFPRLSRYSYDSAAYLAWSREADIVVTTRRHNATLANSFHRPVIYVGNCAKGLEHLPYVYPTRITDLADQIGKLAASPGLPKAIRAWKAQVRSAYRQHFSLVSFEAATLPRGEENWA
jgi:hypothetical protein